MSEIEKIIQALACSAHSNVCPPECPCEYRMIAQRMSEKGEYTTCTAVVATRAMQLLKSYAPVKPIFDDKKNRYLGVWKCGNCKMVMGSAASHVNYCWMCGHAVDWEAYKRDRVHELADNVEKRANNNK